MAKAHNPRHRAPEPPAPWWLVILLVIGTAGALGTVAGALALAVINYV